MGVVVPFFQLHQGEGVRAIAIDLIRARKTEWRIPAEVAGRHQHIHGPTGIHIKVLVGDRSRLVMRGLGCCVDDEIGPLVPEQVAYTLPITNVQGMVPIAGEGGEQLLHHGPCRALLAKKLRPHVIVDPDDLPALTAEYAHALGANESSGARNERLHLLSSTLAMCDIHCTILQLLGKHHPRDPACPCRGLLYIVLKAATAVTARGPSPLSE